MYRFALKPKWILSHLFVLWLAVTMISLGFWQWGKYRAILVTNRTIEARERDRPIDVSRLLKPSDSYLKANGVANRAVRVTGTYLAGQQMLIRGRSLNEEPGSWVMTPLRRADGSLVIINRGWIGNDGALIAVPAADAPPAGTITVFGLVQPTSVRDKVGPKDPPTGHLTSMARADIRRYAQQLDAPVVPAWIQLLSTQPPRGTGADVPELLAPPDLGQGPYFSYAMQWWFFSSVATFGYPLILRRNAREKVLERIDDGYVEPEWGGDPLPGRSTPMATATDPADPTMSVTADPPARSRR